MNTAPSTASQIANSPYTQMGARYGAKKAGTALASKYGSGWKGVSGAKGGAIGIAGDVAAHYLRPKAEAIDMGKPEYADLVSKYRRREEGPGTGVMANAVDWGTKGMQYGGYYGAAIGAAAGAIRGAATKKAKSAYSDFLPDDARTIIGDAYRKYLGRDPEAGAVEGWMTGQGWKPGDKGVGQKHLFEGIDAIRNSEEARMRQGIPGGGINTAPTPGAVPSFTPNAIPSSFLNPETVEMLNQNRRAQLGY